MTHKSITVHICTSRNSNTTLGQRDISENLDIWFLNPQKAVTVILAQFKNKLLNLCSILGKKMFIVGLCARTYYNVAVYIRFPSDCFTQKRLNCSEKLFCKMLENEPILFLIVSHCHSDIVPPYQDKYECICIYPSEILHGVIINYKEISKKC